MYLSTCYFQRPATSRKPSDSPSLAVVLQELYNASLAHSQAYFHLARHGQSLATCVLDNDGRVSVALRSHCIATEL